MKLDTDHANFYSTSRKSYNPFDSDDETLDSPGLEAGNLHVEESGNVLNLKPFEKSSNTIPFHLDNGDFLLPEAVFGHPIVNNHAVNANAAKGGCRSLFEKEGQLNTDKNVPECELPAFIVCYKDTYPQSVKDIGIDDGVPGHNKMWVESSEQESSNDPSKFLAPDTKSNDGLIVENANNMDEVSDLKSPKSTLPSDWRMRMSENSKNADGSNNRHVGGQYLVHEFGTDDSVKITELKLELDGEASLPSWSGTGVKSATGSLVYDSSENNMFSDTVSEKDASKLSHPDLMSKDGALNHGDVMQNKGEDDAPKDKLDQITLVQQEFVRTDTLPKPSTDSGQVKIKPQELQSPKQGEDISADPPDQSVRPEESTESSNCSNLSYNSKLESATITFDFEKPSSGKQSSGLGKEKEGGGGSQEFECPKPPDTQTMTRQEEEGTSSSDNTGSVLDRRVHGETSFSQGVPTPSSITFTGPISYSGSISLRSESSAGSTRSFAFPVLQTEWNSSPVRMAKADQRHLKKHRGWVQAVICCRF